MISREVRSRGEAEGRAGRVLVLANSDSVGGELLLEVLDQSTPAGLDVLVIAPALADRAPFWMSDTDDAAERAETTLRHSLAGLASRGIHIEGRVGDDDPLQALDDAISTFDPDEVVIVTHPADQENWLEEEVVLQARGRYEVPIVHFAPSRNGALSRVDSPKSAPTPREGHQVRDWALFFGAVALAILGTWASFLFAGADVPRWFLISWVVVLDLGFKIVVLPFVAWWIFLRRPRADRLDY